MHFITHLRDERAARGWTREDLSRATGGAVSVRTIASIETDPDHQPQRATRAFIAAAFARHPADHEQPLIAA